MEDRDDVLLFELCLRFKGDEGDEVPVMDLRDMLVLIIETNTNVRIVQRPELRVLKPFLCEGRHRAASD